MNQLNYMSGANQNLVITYAKSHQFYGTNLSDTQAEKASNRDKQNLVKKTSVNYTPYPHFDAVAQHT